MPSVKTLLNEREFAEATTVKGGRSWRQVILGALDIEETPRKLGRPKR